MNRFDYVKYDPLATADQEWFKGSMMRIEAQLEKHSDNRYKSLALTALEEAYAWIGKMIRDEQIKRSGSVELQESRTDS